MLPILRAVSSCMEQRWVDQGLAWIEFFDSVRLVELLDQIRSLDFCSEGDLETHLCSAIRRRLVRRFGAPKIAAPKKPPARPKMVRPPGVSEGSWQTVLALRKRPKPAFGRPADQPSSEPITVKPKKKQPEMAA
jgi:hypothetical protein